MSFQNGVSMPVVHDLELIEHVPSDHMRAAANIIKGNDYVNHGPHNLIDDKGNTQYSSGTLHQEPATLVFFLKWHYCLANLIMTSTQDCCDHR